MLVHRVTSPFITLFFLGGSVFGGHLHDYSQEIYHQCQTHENVPAPTMTSIQNIAHLKTATASSTYGNHPPSKLVDGDLNSMAHTNKDKGAWIEIDLASDFILGSISVYNRDDNTAAMQRANNFVVQLLDKDRNALVLHGPEDMSNVDVHTFDLLSEDDENNLLANNKWCFRTRYVKVMLQSTDFLNMKEIKVYPIQKPGVPGLPTITYTQDPDQGFFHFDHSVQLGGLHKVDKITHIKVWGGPVGDNYWGDNTKFATGIDVTYRKTDGTTKELPLGSKAGQQLLQDYPLAEYEFLTKIRYHTTHFAADDVVTGLEFCYSSRQGGHCSPQVGLFQEGRTNHILTLFAENGVIHGLRSDVKTIDTNVGPWNGMMKIGAAYEINRVAEIRLTGASQHGGSWTRENHVITEPNSVHVVNNFRGTTALEADLHFSETVDTTETSLVSNTKSFSQSSTTDMSHTASLSISQEFSVGGGSFGGPKSTTTIEMGYEFSYGTSMTYGSSESRTMEEESSKTFSETFERTYLARAQPGEVVQVELYYDEVVYEFDWTGDVDICFQSDLKNCVSGRSLGLALAGSTWGSQPIPTFEIKANVTDSAKNADDQELLSLQAKRYVVEKMVQSAGREINLRGSNNLQTSSDHLDRYSSLTRYLDELDTKMLDLIDEKGVTPDPQA